MWVAIAILVALTLAAMAYSALVEQDLPANLEWLRPKAPAMQQAPGTQSAPPAAPPVFAKALDLHEGSATRWRLLNDGRAHELHKDFEAAIVIDGQQYAPPAFVLTCLDGQWYVRLEPRLRLQGAHEGKAVHIELQGRRVIATATEKTTVYLHSSDEVLGLFRAGKPLTVKLRYRDIGPQALVFSPAGFSRALQMLPPGCR